MNGQQSSQITVLIVDVILKLTVGFNYFFMVVLIIDNVICMVICILIEGLVSLLDNLFSIFLCMCHLAV